MKMSWDKFIRWYYRAAPTIICFVILSVLLVWIFLPHVNVSVGGISALAAIVPLVIQSRREYEEKHGKDE